MPVVAVVHHLERPFLGHVAGPLTGAGAELVQVHRRAGDALPDPAAIDGLVVLGGEQSAVTAGEDPLLAPELGLLRAAAAADVPVLGICLGGQLLARALGGRVRHAGRVVEWRALAKTPGGAADPLFGPLPEPVPALHFNEDVFDAPPGAEVLVGPAPSGAAAFRAGRSAWGLQYHPDADHEVVEQWIAGYRAWIPDPEAFRAASEQRRDAQARASAILFGGFARIVSERAASR